MNVTARAGSQIMIYFPTSLTCK